MEDILSSSDSEGDADSDEVSKEREEELYAVLHYNDFSKGIPPELLEKYRISSDTNNEFVISFKNSAEGSKPVSDRDDGSKPAIFHREVTPSEGSVTRVTGQVLSDSSTDDDVVLVESDNTNFTNKRSTDVPSILAQIRKRDAGLKSMHSSNLKNGVDVQLRLSLNGIDGSKNISLHSKSAVNPKNRYWKDDEERKSVSIKKRNSETTEAETTTAPISKKRKSADVNEFSSTFSKESKEVESEIAPNPKKRKSPENDGGPILTSISDNQNNDVDIQSKMVLNPKSRYSNGGPEATFTLPLNVAKEVVVEERSDSDDSSVIVVEDPESSRKISISSTESVVALLSSGDEASGFSLNTTEGIAYDSDGNVSDVIEKTKFGWEEVASPRSWTQEMKKYYNSSCERLRYFDHKLIRQQIKKGSLKDWKISPRDLHPNKRPQQRCLICRQTDHLARNCPKKDPTCHMCGVQGHSNIDCPNSICLQCGRRSRQFTSFCRSCSHTLNRDCFNCKQTGHESRACPEKWREFHSTTEGPLKKDKEPRNGPRTLQCCNCGKSNHSFEDCNQQHMSSFTKSLPAYNWLSGRSSSSEDWRVGFSGFSPPNTFEPPFKRRKEHHERHSFNYELPNRRPFTNKSKNKKNKRRKKLHNSF